MCELIKMLIARQGNDLTISATSVRQCFQDILNCIPSSPAHCLSSGEVDTRHACLVIYLYSQ